MHVIQRLWVDPYKKVEVLWHMFREKKQNKKKQT